MGIPIHLVPSFVSTLAFGIQFLIFVYLYSTHRVDFFRYLLWAWAFFTASRGLRLLRLTMSPHAGITGLIHVAGVLGVFCVLSAALLYRWNHRMHRRDAAIAASIALAAGLLGDRVDAITPLRVAIGLMLGGTLIVAGRAFWPRGA